MLKQTHYSPITSPALRTLRHRNHQTQKRIQKDFSPEADFKNRGVTKDDFLGLYMYRDVGMQYWEATHTWVTEYLNVSTCVWFVGVVCCKGPFVFLQA